MRPEPPPAVESRARRGPAPAGPPGSPSGSRKTDDLLAQALDDPSVQTMLDVFPAEIKEVEEM